MKSSEIYLNSQLIFEKDARNNNVERIMSSINGAWKIGYLHTKE